MAELIRIKFVGNVLVVALSDLSRRSYGKLQERFELVRQQLVHLSAIIVVVINVSLHILAVSPYSEPKLVSLQSGHISEFVIRHFFHRIQLFGQSLSEFIRKLFDD